MLYSWNKLILLYPVIQLPFIISLIFLGLLTHAYQCHCLHDHNKGGVTIFYYLSVTRSIPIKTRHDCEYILSVLILCFVETHINAL